MPSLITFAISVAAITLLFKALYDRATTFGAFRNPNVLFHNAGAGDLKFIDGINCEDLHYHAESGHIFAACQGSAGSRAKWFPALGNLDDPTAGADGELRVIDSKVGGAMRREGGRTTRWRDVEGCGKSTEALVSK